MTPFEYYFTVAMAGISGGLAICLPQFWARTISVLTMLGVTVFAGYHGFRMI